MFQLYLFWPCSFVNSLSKKINSLLALKEPCLPSLAHILWMMKADSMLYRLVCFVTCNEEVLSNFQVKGSYAQLVCCGLLHLMSLFKLPPPFSSMVIKLISTMNQTLFVDVKEALTIACWK